MRPRVIAVSTTKGGAGKTTLAAGIASYYFRQGLRVCILDTDPNGNLTRWVNGASTVNNNVHLVHVPDAEELIDVVGGCRGHHDVTVIDCAGVLSQAALYAAGVADLVLIPSRPSEDDVLEAIKTRQIIRNAGAMCRPKREIPYLVVLSSVHRGTLALRHARARLDAFDMRVAKADLRSSVNIQTARFACESPLDMMPWKVDLPELVAEIEA